MVTPQTRPYGKFRWLVEIDGLTLAHFQSVIGLNHQIEVLDQQEGGINDRLHKLPSQGSYPNVTLKLGYTTDKTLERWHRDYLEAPWSAGRKNGSIVMLGDDGSEIARWNFVRAWPVKWMGPDLDATSSQNMVESIEIAHEGITRA